MESKLVHSMRLPVSLCGEDAKLSYTGLVTLFMDIASEHGEDLGLGRKDLLEKGLFWIVSKTKVKIYALPEMLEPVTLCTWPEAPGRIRCNRYYTLSSQEKILAEGKNEWAMLEAETGRPHKIDGLYPENFEHCNDLVCDTPFTKISEDFSEFRKIKTHTVTSADIDGSHHMNNLAFLRAAFGIYSCKELSEMKVDEIEISYRAQCYEGENLEIKERVLENSRQIAILKEDKKAAAVINISFKD